MDTFDLQWPQSDATFFTDGWRCRIVWRERRGGLGGTIDNNDQAKRRVAASLSNAPYLLNALRARGHGVLAGEIEVLCSVDQPDAESGQVSADQFSPQDPSVAPATAAKQIAGWLASLDGDSGWEAAGIRRAKIWQTCGEVADGEAFLKAPAAGKSEWVLKRTYKGSKRKTEYLAAPALKGICEYLHQQGWFADATGLETWLAAVQVMAHADLAKAAAAWRAAGKVTTH
jgi:hypothetical protein